MDEIQFKIKIKMRAIDFSFQNYNLKKRMLIKQLKFKNAFEMEFHSVSHILKIKTIFPINQQPL